MTFAERPLRSLAPLLVAVAMALGAGCGGAAAGSSALPAVELTAPDGTVIDSASLTGEPMVINFWFSTCPPCAAELGDFAEVHAEVGDEVRFVGVNPLDDAARMESFAADRGVEYELFSDRAGELQDRLGISSFPATVFVSADGTVVGLEGVMDDDALRDEIDELLNGDRDGFEFAESDSSSGDDWHGIRRQPAPIVPATPLPLLDGESLMLRPEQGRVRAVYFGYTACPDVCPTTMADLSVALRSLGDRADSVGTLMISVDPTRDIDHLAGYVSAFVPGGDAVAVDDDELLDEVAAPFGASWDVRELADGTVEVDHTPFLYLVGDDGRLAVSWPFGTSSQHMADDIKRLLDSQKA